MDSSRFSSRRLAFLIGVPLAWAVLLLAHPLGSGDICDELRGEVTGWQVVHVGTLLFIGLMGLAVYLLVRDLPGTAARVSRWAAAVFILFYGAWEAVAGLAVGALVRYTNGLPAAERSVGLDAIESSTTTPSWATSVSSVVSARSPGSPR